MSEMVERVAKAMAEKQRGCDLWDEIAEMSDMDYIGKDEFRDLARAAIAEMREPTEAMLDADAMYPTHKIDARMVWLAMIDEVLK